MLKAIKIALLYWFRQSLGAFCPHESSAESRRYYKHVCPNCALWIRVYDALSHLCGINAIYQLRKCDLCHDPLSKEESDVHLACANRENARAEQEALATRHVLQRIPADDLPF